MTQQPFNALSSPCRVLGFFTAVNASVNVKRTDRGDEMFLTMARRHGDQIRSNGTLELIGA